MAIVRWNPGRELLNVEREFNKLFNSIGDRYFLRGDKDDEYENAVWMPLTDISETDDNYVLKVDLPGIEKKDVKISFNDGKLTISGERKQESEEKDSKLHRVERSYGKYYRAFTLPQKIKEDQINAEFKDGQLKITVPKAEEAKPREIEVKVK